MPYFDIRKKSFKKKKETPFVCNVCGDTGILEDVKDFEDIPRLARVGTTPIFIRIPSTKEKLYKDLHKYLPNYPAQIFFSCIGKPLHFICIRKLEWEYIKCCPLEELMLCINTQWLFPEESQTLFRNRFKEGI